MGLHMHLDAEGDLFSHDLHKEQNATGKTPQAVDLYDDSDPLRAARGTFVGVILGGILWAAILWVLL